MLDPVAFLDGLKHAGIDFFAGVPDSLLKDVCACMQATLPAAAHVITANEGNAVAMAVGHFVATGKPGLVYLQNSGLGNVVNPVTSLADREVYSIPMVLMIGWRGEPGVKDEPQHVKQGRVTPAMLDALEIPYAIVDAHSDAQAVIGAIVGQAVAEQRPTAILIRKDAFSSYALPARDEPYPLVREEAIRKVAQTAGKDTVIVATTGHTSRELYEYRIGAGDAEPMDFLTVGGMGHTSSIALGVALARPEQFVVCLDGDGSALMHLGMFPIIGAQAPGNFLHVLLNNGAHDSVGGQPTVGFSTDFQAIAKAGGYKATYLADSLETVEKLMADARQGPRPALLEIRVKRGARKDLGRPKSTPLQNRDALMKRLGHG